MDEPTLLRLRKAVNEGKLKPRRASGLRVPVLMGLQGEAGFPHEGDINFVNNQLNPSTGSILVRGVFPNPKPPGGTRLLSPGMFVRIRLPIGEPHPAVLVIDRAISSDQGIKFVYVVDKENKVQYRRVTTTSLQEDGLRVVTDGLKPDEWVVVAGLQQVRPRVTIHPEQGPMPALVRDSESDTTKAQETEAQPAVTPKAAAQPAQKQQPAKPVSTQKGAAEPSASPASTTAVQPPEPPLPPQNQLHR